MTIQQLQYVLEISRTGSVSKAARNLYLSQPNLSNAIKNLETELGITIFERTPMGMQMTVAGERLVQKAADIMDTIRDITAVSSEEEVTRFRFTYPRYIPAYEAFCELCRRYEKKPYLNLSCYISNGDRQVEAICKNHCELAVFANDNFKELKRCCVENHIVCVPFVEVPYCIQISEHHPILKEKFTIGHLKDYPYVAFADFDNWNGNWFPWEDIVNPDRLICVQSTTARVSLVSSTSAYSIVLPHSEEYNRMHHVVQIPLPGTAVTVGYLYSQERGLSSMAEEYLELFKRELRFINGTDVQTVGLWRPVAGTAESSK